MYFEDFKYDGLYLSDFDCITCSFDGGGLETVSIGSNIDFRTTPSNYGKKYLLANSEYDSCIESTFCICKNPCKDVVDYFIPEEVSELMRWLNRRRYYKFQPCADGYENIYYEASFNVNQLEFSGKIIGFELNLITNRPFALHEPITHIFEAQADNPFYIVSRSDDIGYENVKMEVTCKSAGNLTISNGIEERNTVVNNCTQNEVITFECPIISSSVSSHKIQNDFNFNFPRIANTYQESKNSFTFSLPCSVKMTYSPIKKVGV